MARAPTVEQVVLWGLCDAASAILLYGPSDARVVGQVLINPWVRTPEGLARTHLRHYYVGRLLSASFWRKLSTGALDVRATLGSLVGSIRLATGMPATGRRGPRSLPERMADGLRRFRGASLLILCGADLTAREFEDRSRDVAWQGLIDGDRVTMFRLPAADHTFSRAEWREAVIERTNAWLARSVGAEVSGR
jgi:exosortase A-associated hydrolase 1